MKRKLIILLLALAPLQAFAAPKPDNLPQIKKDIEAKKQEEAAIAKEQKAVKKDIDETSARLVSIAANIRGYEKQQSQHDAQLKILQTREAELNEKLAAGNENLAKLLAVFENMAVVPKGYLIVSSNSAEQTFYTSILLKNITHQLAVAQAQFKLDLDSLAKTEEDIIKAKIAITSTAAKVKVEQDKVSELIKKKRVEEAKLSEKKKQTAAAIARLAKDAKSIEDFIKKAEVLRKASGGAVVKSFSGNISMPITGAISTYFGETKSGVKSKGLYIKTAADRQVVSPVDAEVVFAGAFMGYKNLMILHGADGFYIILGGLSELYSTVGASLLVGEPIGKTSAGDFYIEIRSGTVAINPVKYFKI